MLPSRCFAVLRQTCELAQDFGGTRQTLLGRLPFLEEHHLHVGPDPRCLAVLADEIDQPIRLGELVVAEGDDSALRPRIDLFDVGASAIVLDGGNLEQLAHLVRQHAETIAQLGREIVDLLVGFEVGKPAIQRQPNR